MFWLKFGFVWFIFSQLAKRIALHNCWLYCAINRLEIQLGAFQFFRFPPAKAPGAHYVEKSATL